MNVNNKFSLLERIERDVGNERKKRIYKMPNNVCDICRYCFDSKKELKLHEIKIHNK